jgi:hypothetical protein
VVALIAAWCIPLVIALLYDLPRKGAIAVLSLALEWTGAGWVGAIRAPAPMPMGPRQGGYPPPSWPPPGRRPYGAPTGPVQR